MKKIFYFTLALALAAGVSSCKNEEDDIFDDTAANRLEQIKKDYANVFTDQGGKWALEYFANSEESGYVFVVTFDKDGSVQMSGNNKWTATTSFDTDNSLWGMISDDGPVLSFNSYNKVFHVFSSPENIIGGPTNPELNDQDIDETGKGHEGDYEFIVMGVSEDGQEVNLQGKKRGYKALLRRLPADTDDRAYLAKVYENNHSNVCTEFGTLLLHEITTDERFTVTEVSDKYMEGQLGYFEAYPQGGDSIMQTVEQNAIITFDGLRFRHDLEIPRANSNEVITINSFKFQPDGSLLGVSNPDVVLRAPMLADIMRNSSVEVAKRHVWNFEDCTLNASADALLDKVKAGLTQNFRGQRDFNGFGVTATNINTIPTPSIFLTFGTAKAYLYLTITRVDDNTIRIEPDGTMDGNLTNLIKMIPECETLLKSFAGTYTLDTDNVMCPYEIRWVGDNGISFSANLQR